MALADPAGDRPSRRAAIGCDPSAQLPVYVINLDRRPDRWRRISEHLDCLGLPAQRIPAVDATLLAHQEGWEQRANGNPPAWKIDLGAVACAFSHAQVLGAFLDTEYPAALVLEDDAQMAPDVSALLSVDWWPRNACLIRLEAGAGPHWPIPLSTASHPTPTGRRLHKLERWAPGSAAYLINRAGAALLLPYLEDPQHPMDHLLYDHRYCASARALRALQILPAAARQTEGAEASDLVWWREEGELTGWTRRKYRLKRNLGSLPYKTRLYALLCLGKVRRCEVAYRDMREEGRNR